MPNSKAKDTEIVTMVITAWQIGLEIQHETLRAVAVQRRRQGWQLRHWWLIPLPENTFREGVLQSPENLIKGLAQWRRELPLRHQLRVAFPTQRTLQRPVPTPDNRLQEPARESYLAAAAARQLQMTPAQLSWDYTAMPQDPAQLRVIAARYSEVQEMLTSLAKQRLFPATLTPGASVLPALGSLCGPAKPRFLVHRECDHWLWATSSDEPEWGWVDARQAQTFSDLCLQLAVEPHEVAFSSAVAEPVPSGALPLDAWRALVRLQPPLPQHGGSFTVAIGLAIGRVSR
ncbi:pilus assembly protein [Enterobacteriaceae bacterium H20N1]|uniref:Pilus assembly protein n=1 Tax=Dryocola boscaweniae TaxID=2925397 RepID=A0A9X3APK6_9ENTR|nr:pilus assembly protein [Dryocola boscaweniae]MCT4703461.1 pilus assembly protein [Dryocola boscaweniae]MCT4715852.1 pilus assembly protein [Dryocola boscaweniae]MCT4720629.1 pilus assembly protein [Dryocola boscaweniae]